MADNITLNAGSGGSVLATDDIGSVHYQLVKLGYGALDAFTIVTASAGLPVQQQSGAVFDVDVQIQPARDRLTDNVGVALQTDALLNDTTALTPKFAKISAAASGDNTLVALVAGKKIRVLSIALVSTGVVSAYLQSSGGTAIFADGTNKIPLDNTGGTGAGGFVLGFNPLGWCESASGEALEINLSAAVGVCGSLSYVEV